MQNAKAQNVVPLPSRRIEARSAPAPASPTIEPMRFKPSLTTPPMVPFARWQQACEQVSAALLAGKQRVLVTGPAGIGKSLLLEHVARVMRALGWTVTLRLADATPIEGDQDGKAVLLIDEADQLAPEQLKALFRRATAPVVMSGLDAMRTRLPGTLHVTLPALSRDEARSYIAQWLQLSGRGTESLEADGMLRLVEVSGGAPRLLSTVLGAASWLADTGGDKVVTKEHIDEAAALRASFATTEPERSAEPVGPAASAAMATRARRNPAWHALTAAAACVIAGVSTFMLAKSFPTETRRAAEFAGHQAARVQSMLSSEAERLLAAREPVSATVKPSETKPARAAATEPTPTRRAATPSRAEAAQDDQAPLPLSPPASVSKPIAVVAPTVAPRRASTVASTGAADAARTIAAAQPKPAAPSQHAAETPSATVAHSALPPATLELLLRRGQDMLAIGDVSAARLLFSRAAETGDAEAMMDMGRTFDPTILAQTGLLLRGDPAEAARWYQRADAAGAPDARSMLRGLKFVQ